METVAKPCTVDFSEPSSISNGTMSMPIESLPGLSLTSFGFIVERYIVFFLGAACAGAVAWDSPLSKGTKRIPQI